VRRALVGVAMIVALVVVAVFLAPAVIPDSIIKARLAAVAAQRTGRELRIAGPVTVSLFPSLAIVAHDVAVSSPPGGFTADFLQARTVEASVKLLPLLHGAIEIEHCRVSGLRANPEIDRDGKRNWIFHRPTAPATSATSASNGDFFALSSATIDLADGAARYLDQRSGKFWRASDISMTMSLPALPGPARVEGTAAVDGEKVAYTLTAASPEALGRGGTSGVSLSIVSAPLNLDFTGEIGGGASKARGAIRLGAPSLRHLLTWTGLFDLRSEPGALSIDGNLDASRSKFVLSDAKLVLGAIKANGTLSVERGAKRPALAGRLDIADLDLNSFLHREKKPVPPPPEPAPPVSSMRVGGVLGVPGEPAPAAAPSSVDLSNARIDLAPLKLLDAELDIRADGLRFHRVEIGHSILALHLKDGRLQVDVPEMALYRGTGTGMIVADDSGPGPGFAGKFDLRGITIEHLPLHFAGLDALSGTGDISFNLAGRGGSPREIVGSLLGAGGIALANGTIGSGGLGPLMRNSLGPVVSDNSIPRTLDYDSLSASWTVAQGVLRSTDLKLGGAKLTATASGSLDLSRRSIDYLWFPDIAGVGRARIAISGTWDAPIYRAESVTIIRSPPPATAKPAAPPPATAKPAAPPPASKPTAPPRRR
jgi:AsmA protein